MTNPIALAWVKTEFNNEAKPTCVKTNLRYIKKLFSSSGEKYRNLLPTVKK